MSVKKCIFAGKIWPTIGYTTIVIVINDMIYLEDIEYLFQGSRDLIWALDEEMDRFEKVDSFDIISLFNETDMIGKFLKACELTERECADVDVSNLDISNYLALLDVYYNFGTVTDRFAYLLKRIKDHHKELEFDAFDNHADYLMFHFLNESESANLNGYLQSFNDLKNRNIEAISNMIDLAESLRMDVLENIDYIGDELMTDEELKKFIIREFRRFAADEKYNFKQELRNYALKLKTNRLEPLSRIHWAKLADLDDEIVKKVINGEKIDENAYKDYYDVYDMMELKHYKKILSELREIANPEALFDWDVLFERHYSMHPFLNTDNVYFFFNRVHRENLIKCELYDGLAEQYQKFLNGLDEKDVATNAAPQIPAQITTESSKVSDGIINKRIDEAKLIDLIKNYVDGSHKSNYFDKKSYWLSIYIVLRQKLEQLDGSPIFLPASRPKFVKWVNDNIQPVSVPCDKGALDTPPSYFRDEKNYPWDIQSFYKAGGSQEKTFNGYSMVADYFQTNLIECLADFLILLVP